MVLRGEAENQNKDHEADECEEADGNEQAAWPGIDLHSLAHSFNPARLPATSFALQTAERLPRGVTAPGVSLRLEPLDVCVDLLGHFSKRIRGLIVVDRLRTTAALLSTIAHIRERIIHQAANVTWISGVPGRTVFNAIALPSCHKADLTGHCNLRSTFGHCGQYGCPVHHLTRLVTPSLVHAW